MSRLKEKDTELLLGGQTIDLSSNEYSYLGGEFLDNVDDFVEVLIYDTNKNFLESSIVNSNDYSKQDDGTLKLKTGTILRRMGYDRGRFTVKYNFLRKVAGSYENLLVDSNGNNYTGAFNPQNSVDVSRIGNDLFLKENKYYIHEISPSRNEIRLAPQKLSDEKYLRQFYDAQKTMKRVKPNLNFDSRLRFTGNNLDEQENSTTIEFVDDSNTFLPLMQGGVFSINNSFVTKLEPIPVPTAPGADPVDFETEGDMRARFYLDRANSFFEVPYENSDQLGDPYFKRVYNIFNNNGVGLQDDELYGGYGSGVSLAYNGEGNIPDTFKVMKNIYRMTQSNNNPAPVVFEYDASRPNTIILRSNSTLPNLEIPTTYTWEVTGWFKQQDNDFSTIYPAEGNNGGAFILQSDSADSVIAVPTGVQNPYQAITSDSTDGSGLILSLSSNSISIGIKLTVQQATGIGVQSTSTIFLPGIISNRDF